MRNLVYALLILLLLVITSCSNNHNEKEQNNNLNIEQDNQEEIIEEEPDAEENNNEQNEENTTQENENEQEEIVKATYEVNQETWSITPLDDANEKVDLLTIDDAPDGHALEMAETLQALDANAIFFVNGHFLESDEQKETIKEIFNMGFMIGNHTYSHPDLTELSVDEQKEEIVRVNDMVKEITGEYPQFFRAPFGNNTDYSKRLVKKEGMVFMNWTYGYDWEPGYQTKESITDIMINTEYLRDGANLLMHDREWTAAALHDIVVGLRDKGYEIVDPKLIKTE